MVADSVSEEENVANSIEGAEEEVRCIKKVMQVGDLWQNILGMFLVDRNCSECSCSG